MKIAIRAEALTFTTKGRSSPIVDDVSLELREQEFFVLVGPNGAGKSTLLELLGGLRRPTVGRVEVLGDDIHRLGSIDRARRIARIPQTLESWPDVSVRRFVEHGRYAHDRSGDVDASASAAAVTSALERADLTLLADRDLKSLSGGERQRALVARALAQEAPILLADEPTTALDPRGQLTVLELLARSVCDGHTVLAVTHDLGLASQFADRIGLLSEGRICAIDDPESLLASDALDRLYGDSTLFRSAFPPDGLGVRRPLVATWRRVPRIDLGTAAPEVDRSNDDPNGAESGDSAHTLASPPDARVELLDGRIVDYFGGTSYLGLHADEGARRRAADSLLRTGLHAATSRHGAGALRILDEAETALARFVGTESARTFSSGWTAATAVARCFDPGRPVLVDAHTHPAQLDAWRGAASIRRFSHSDPESLAAELEALGDPALAPIVASDTVFAIEGDVAPIEAYLEVCTRHPGTTLVLDDSHGLGVLGDRGRGAIEAFDLASRTGLEVVVFASLSKACGGQGGAVFGTRRLAGTIDERAPQMLGSTPLGPPAAAALIHNLGSLADDSRLRRLRQALDRLDAGLRGHGLYTALVDHGSRQRSAIRSLRVADPRRGDALSASLLDEDLLVPFFDSYPGQPGGVLRIACCANHDAAAIDRLVEALWRRRAEFAQTTDRPTTDGPETD